MSRPRILAVDDEIDILEVLETALAHDGFDFHGVTSIEAFQVHLAQELPDLCLVDLGLPDGNGLKLVRELRARYAVGIIILTGRGAELDRVLGLEFGADDYVTKPFRPRELVARVRAVFRRSAPASRGMQSEEASAAVQPESRVHEFAGFRLSPASRRLWSPEGQEVVLTNAEFTVLLALVECRGRVLSRDQIMALAKGREWESNDRAVDGVVSRLRRKLPMPSGETHLIRTVQGLGYVLN